MGVTGISSMSGESADDDVMPSENATHLDDKTDTG